MTLLENVNTLLTYNEQTGVFVWAKQPSRAVKQGQTAGSAHPTGYVFISIKSKLYAAHRLAWLVTHGTLPLGHIDHINGIRDDNRINNLRDVTHTENLQGFRHPRSNSVAKMVGVTYRKDCCKWQARMQRNGTTQFLGMFNTPEEASAAYQAAKINS